MWLLAAVLVTVLNYFAVGMNADVTMNLINEFITGNKLKAAVAMTCWKTAGNGCLYSRFIVRTVQIQVVQSVGRHTRHKATQQ
jgi:hypothetical protein